MSGAEARGVTLLAVTDFKSITGKGVEGKVDGKRIVLGNHSMMEASGVNASALAERAEALRADGQTVMFVGIGVQLAGLTA